MVCLYSTLRVVKIPSRCLGITYFLIVLSVLGYIGGYGLAYSKGYQVSAPVQSVVVTKVKGTLLTKYTERELQVNHPYFYNRVWDAPDIVSPADGGENGGFFIMTNIIITPNQTRSTCAESYEVVPARCKTHKDCTMGKSFKNGNGVATGRCDGRTCEVDAWCPVEQDKPPLGENKALLVGTKEFSVLVKNTIEFPAFGPGYRRRNILQQSTESYLSTCLYDKKTDPYCPTFRIGSIVEAAGYSYDQVAIRGGIFLLNIKWDCSFDWGYTIDRHCLPQYSFSRLDDPKATVSPGFNFRTVVYHEENRRTLTQRYGLRFLIEVEGEGRMFDSVRFLLTVGAGVGFFAVASLVCDFFLDLFCKLQQYSKSPWFASFNEEMKYDLGHVRQYENIKQARRGIPRQKEDIGLQEPT